MILKIFLEIVGYWLALGAVISTVMIICLYFAVACEKIVDYYFKHKYQRARFNQP